MLKPLDLQLYLQQKQCTIKNSKTDHCLYVRTVYVGKVIFKNFVCLRIQKLIENCFSKT